MAIYRINKYGIISRRKLRLGNLNTFFPISFYPYLCKRVQFSPAFPKNMYMPTVIIYVGRNGHKNKHPQERQLPHIFYLSRLQK